MSPDQIALTPALWVVAGALIVAVALFDIVATVLHPEVESPISTSLQRAGWRLLRRLDRLLPGGGPDRPLLGWGTPLLVAGLVGFWLVALLVGFGLIFAPWIGDPASFTASNPIEGTLLDALYYSGVTLATLGYGDIQPRTAPLRLLAVSEALLGAVTISAAVAYILSVYPALGRQREFATALDAEVAGHASALPLLRRYRTPQGGWHPELSGQLRALAHQLLEITDQHQTRPILYYARPRHMQHSFLRVLVTVQSLVGLLRYGLSPHREREIVYHPHLLFLEQALHYTLRRLSYSMHFPPVQVGPPGQAQARLDLDYERVCAELAAIGLATALDEPDQGVPVLVGGALERPGGPDGALARAEGAGAPHPADDPALDERSPSPHDAYRAFRSETDPYLEAYAAVCGYSLDEARADETSGLWTGAAPRG